MDVAISNTFYLKLNESEVAPSNRQKLITVMNM